MKTPKLFQLLQLLDETEFKRLYKFIRSPFFSYTSTIVKYYESIRRYYPGFDSPRLTPERLWERLFPDEPFHELKYWQLSSRFAGLVKKYLTILELEQNETEMYHLYIKALGNRNGYSLFQKETFEAINRLEKQPFRDEQYFKQRSLLLSDYFFHPLTPKRNLKDDALQQAVESTDRAFVLSKLRLGIELRAREKILNTSYHIEFLDEALHYTTSIRSHEGLPFCLYFLIHQLLDKQVDHEIFYRLKEKLAANMGSLQRIDQQTLITQLINYAIDKINRGEKSFYKEAFDLYKVRLNTDLLLENGKIDEAVFGNIVYLACMTREIEWAKTFVESYAQFLDESIRDDTIIYSLASVKYYSHDFQETIRLLTMHSFPLYDQIKVRTLICHASFDGWLQSDEYEEFLHAQINSFEKFLRRDELYFDNRKQAALAYLKFLKRLLKLQSKGITTEYSRLKLAIQSEECLLGKNWLLSKLDTIKE